MNNILQKCLTELSQEHPKLDYVRGMLETLLEMQGGQKITTTGPLWPAYTTSSTEKTDEASILDSKARAAIDLMKKVTPGTIETA